MSEIGSTISIYIYKYKYNYIYSFKLIIPIFYDISCIHRYLQRPTNRTTRVNFYTLREFYFCVCLIIIIIRLINYFFLSYIDVEDHLVWTRFIFSSRAVGIWQAQLDISAIKCAQKHRHWKFAIKKLFAQLTEPFWTRLSISADAYIHHICIIMIDILLHFIFGWND